MTPVDEIRRYAGESHYGDCYREPCDCDLGMLRTLLKELDAVRPEWGSGAMYAIEKYRPDRHQFWTYTTLFHTIQDAAKTAVKWRVGAVVDGYSLRIRNVGSGKIISEWAYKPEGNPDE